MHTRYAKIEILAESYKESKTVCARFHLSDLEKGVCTYLKLRSCFLIRLHSYPYYYTSYSLCLFTCTPVRCYKPKI